jgi:hypothetical protein
MSADSADAQLAELGAALLVRADALSDPMVALMRRDASRPDREPITVFDRDVLAVGAPEVMSRIAANVLGSLDDLPDHEREALLETLEA